MSAEQLLIEDEEAAEEVVDWDKLKAAPESRRKSQSPLETYLREINDFPLLTRNLEKSLADLRDDSNEMIIEMGANLWPYIRSSFGTSDRIGIDLRKCVETLKRNILYRHEKIHESNTENDDAEEETHVEETLTAAKALHDIIIKAERNETDVIKEHTIATDDLGLVQKIFALMPELTRLCNRICTSDIAEVPALVAILQDAFRNFASAFPSHHAVRKLIMERRHSLMDAENTYIDDELRDYFDELRMRGKMFGVDESSAREILTRANLRLVVNIARSFTGKGLGLQDLIQEGNFGLMRAVDGFDPLMQTKFSTYASYWIKQNIKRALINTAKSVRVPAYMVEIIAKFRRQAAKMKDKTNSEPDFLDVCKELKLPDKKIDILRKALVANQNVGQQAEGGGKELPLEEAVADDSEQKIPLETREALSKAFDYLDRLDKREREVLSLRFGLIRGKEPMTLKEIGEHLGLTRERVRQIESEALVKLEDMAKSDQESTMNRKRPKAVNANHSANREAYVLKAVDRDRIAYKLRIIRIAEACSPEQLTLLKEREFVTGMLIGIWKRQRGKMELALQRHCTLTEERHPLEGFIPTPPEIIQLPSQEEAVPTRTRLKLVLRPPKAAPPKPTYKDMIEAADSGEGELFLITGFLALSLDIQARTRLLNFLMPLNDPGMPVSSRGPLIAKFFAENSFSSIPEKSVDFIARNTWIVISKLHRWMEARSMENHEGYKNAKRVSGNEYESRGITGPTIRNKSPVKMIS